MAPSGDARCSAGSDAVRPKVQRRMTQSSNGDMVHPTASSERRWKPSPPSSQSRASTSAPPDSSGKSPPGQQEDRGQGQPAEGIASSPAAPPTHGSRACVVDALVHITASQTANDDDGMCWLRDMIARVLEIYDEKHKPQPGSERKVFKEMLKAGQTHYKRQSPSNATHAVEKVQRDPQEDKSDPEGRHDDPSKEKTSISQQHDDLSSTDVASSSQQRLSGGGIIQTAEEGPDTGQDGLEGHGVNPSEESTGGAQHEGIKPCAETDGSSSQENPEDLQRQTAGDPARGTQDALGQRKSTGVESGDAPSSKGKLKQLCVKDEVTFRKALDKLPSQYMVFNDHPIDFLLLAQNVALYNDKVNRKLARDAKKEKQKAEEERQTRQHAEGAKDNAENNSNNDNTDNQGTQQGEDNPDEAVTLQECWQITFNIIAHILVGGVNTLYNVVRASSQTGKRDPEPITAKGSRLQEVPKLAPADIEASIDEYVRVVQCPGASGDKKLVDSKRLDVLSRMKEYESEFESLSQLFRVYQEQELKPPVRKVYDYYDRLQAVRQYDRLNILLTEEVAGAEAGASQCSNGGSETGFDGGSNEIRSQGDSKKIPKGPIGLLLAKHGIETGPGLGIPTLILRYIRMKMSGLDRGDGIPPEDTRYLAKQINTFYPVCGLVDQLGISALLLLANKKDLVHGLATKKEQLEGSERRLYYYKKIFDVAGLFARCDAKMGGPLAAMFADIESKIWSPLLRIRANPGLKTWEPACLSKKELDKTDAEERLSSILAKINGGNKDGSDFISVESESSLGKRRRSSDEDQANEAESRRRRKAQRPSHAAASGPDDDGSDRDGTTSPSEDKPPYSSGRASSTEVSGREYDTAATSDPEEGSYRASQESVPGSQED